MSENNKKAAPKATDNDDLLGETPKAETPKAETPKTETPKTETPKTETPKTETPKAETPKAAKKPSTPKVSAAEKKKIEAAQDGSDYLPEENERHLVHVKMEKKVFSPSTGKKLAKDFVQKYNTKEWSAFQKNGGGLGFTCTVLWNPENYK
jgi:hypothetical protein